MGQKLLYQEFEDFFQSGHDFSLTDTQYEEKVGRALPKNASYIKNRSPLAQIAKKHGYLLQISETAMIQRTIHFIKNSKKL